MAETFKQFCDGPEGVIALVFPEGEQETLVVPHRADIKAALIYIQRYVPYYQKRSRDVYPFCSTYFNCGATVVEAPRGRIQRVYTLVNQCCPVQYDFIDDYDTFRNWLTGNHMRWDEPANAGMPSLPSGFKFSEDSADKGRRFNFGKWNLHNQRIYLAHRIESEESVVVEWEGIKRNWAPDDLMPYDDPEEGDPNDRGVELKNAVAAFVRSEHWRKFERSNDWVGEKAIFDNLIAEMKHEDFMERTPKIMPEREYDQLNVSGTCGAQECRTVTPATSGYFAVLGDWGNLANGTATQDVARLIESWNPQFIVTTGDNRYNTTYDNVFAAAPFYDTMREAGLFFPAIGNHDTLEGGGLTEYLNTFSYLPGNKRYYDIQLGHVHFFVLNVNNAGTLEADGVGPGSIQAAWLRVRLAASKAPFKVVISQDAPFTSATDDYPGHAYAELPYKEWGADLVINGDSHHYERLEVDGFPYIVNGFGGAVKLGFHAPPVDGSVIRYSDVYGAMRGSATCNLLTLEFINYNGELIDTFTLEKP